MEGVKAVAIPRPQEAGAHEMRKVAVRFGKCLEVVIQNSLPNDIECDLGGFFLQPEDLTSFGMLVKQAGKLFNEVNNDRYLSRSAIHSSVLSTLEQAYLGHEVLYGETRIEYSPPFPPECTIGRNKVQRAYERR